MDVLKRFAMYPVFVVSLVVSWYIWNQTPDYIHQGGPLLILGLTCFFLVVTFWVERSVVLWRAGGRGNALGFIREIRNMVSGGDLDPAVAACKEQGGSLGNVIGAGLERYQRLRTAGRQKGEALNETRRAIQEAGAMESPLLERNLPALATLASIATLIGLLGTTIGMIRAFRAMSRAGAPDATQLALGISEALVNTALGLITAILGTVLYNYFTSRVDGVVNKMDETSFEVMQLLESRREP
jgi:biopolymer transport protein ExbB